jgi:hypothetical protein
MAFTVDERGSILEDRYHVQSAADQPLVLASTMKIVVLAVYADAVVKGDIDPQEEISVADWEKYYLPNTDGGAHIGGLRSVNLESDALGFARDQTVWVTLDDLARIMIHYSGNAATDYLINRLGTENFASILALLDLRCHTMIWPTLGLSLAIYNHENPHPTVEQLKPWVAFVEGGDNSEFARLAELYLRDRAWRQAQIEFLTSDGPGGGENLEEIWAYQVAASQVFPNGCAREYARLMALAATGNLISPQVSALVKEKLESVPSDWPLRLGFYRQYGGKEGITAGVTTIVSYSIPKRGPLAGLTRVVVIFANEQPLDIWSKQLQFYGHYLLQTDLAMGAGVFNKFCP